MILPEIRIPQEADKREELIRELKNQPDLVRELKLLQVDLKELDLHPSQIQRWWDNRKLCEHCTGLSQCRQKQKGYREVLQYDGVLNTDLFPCQYTLRKEETEKHLAQYLVCDLSDSLRTVSFAGIDYRSEDQTYLNVLKKVLGNYRNDRGVFLYGPMGTGKTYLAACAANEAAGSGKTTAFVHCPQFAERIRATQYSKEYQTETERLKYADFVVFDDIGAEEVSAHILNLLLGILDHRMQDHKVTWFTSNADHNSLLNQYSVTGNGENKLLAMRILERISVLSEPVYLSGKNRRHA
ncbi:MAG: ATP-binding protein [Solobacterium sp.]|nr:ATP-binding protein [Solobacterium sp.]